MMRQAFSRAAAVAAGTLLGLGAGPAGAVFYDVAIVDFQMGFESFATETPTGSISGSIKSSNLPIDLFSSMGSYTPAGFGAPYSGELTLIGAGDDKLVLAFDSPGHFQTFGGPLGRSTATTTIVQGFGAFAGASGGGTFEAFTRGGTSFDPFGQGYEQVMVNRLQFTLPAGEEQQDTRRVSVSARVGIDDLNTSRGVNVGVPTSDSGPPLPPLTNLRAEYVLGPVPYFGVSENSNDAGDSQRWSFETQTAGNITPFFFLATGEATLLSGTGFYENFTGHSDWEAYSVGMGPVADQVFSYSVVSIDRYTVNPIPEPQTYAMLLVGLVGLGVALRRRLNSL